MQQRTIDPGAVDPARIAAVSNALGSERFGELLTILSIRLQRLSCTIETLPANAAELLSALHQSRGSASSLGLVGLTIVLTDIEAQIACMMGTATSSNPTTLARLRIAGRALPGHCRAAADAASIHLDHAAGIRSE